MIKFFKKIRPIALLIFLLITHLSQSQNLIIKGGWIVLADSNKVVPNHGTLINKGRIESLNFQSNEESIKTLELKEDDYILPGFFDLHAHLKIIYQDIIKEDTIVTPQLYLANGVTTIFTCGDMVPETVVQYKSNIENDKSIGPRILNSGPFFGHYKNEWSDSLTQRDIFEKVDYWASKGVDGIKVKDLTADHLKNVIDRAHYHGLTVTGHLSHIKHPEVGSQIAVPLGIDRLEHFIGGAALPGERNAYAEVAELDLSDSAIEESMDLLIENNVYFNSTLTVIGGSFTQSKDKCLEPWLDEQKFFSPYTQSIMINNPKRWSERRDKFYLNSKLLLKRYYDKGGLISMGTDGPLILDFIWDFDAPGFNTHREAAMMSDIGIPNNEVIKIATINSAKAMGLEEDLGSIETGKIADLMIIKGNPLKDIYATRTVHTIIKGGKVYDTKTLLDECEGKLGLEGDISKETK